MKLRTITNILLGAVAHTLVGLLIFACVIFTDEEMLANSRAFFVELFK